MASASDRKRRRRQRSISLARDPARLSRAAPAPASGTSRLAPAEKPVSAPREDGLAMLRARGRITPRQALTGAWYGMAYRTAAIALDAPVRTSDPARASGGGGGNAPGDWLEGAEWIAECRRQLAAARAAIGGDDDLIAVLDLICGQGCRPREITTVQREAEQIETALRICLDLIWLRCAEDIRRQGRMWGLAA